MGNRALVVLSHSPLFLLFSLAHSSISSLHRIRFDRIPARRGAYRRRLRQ